MKETSLPDFVTRQSESPRLAMTGRGKSANHSVTRVFFLGLGRIGKSPTSKYAAHICASPSSLLTRTTQRSNGFEGATLLNCSIITGIDVRKVVAADLTKASSMFSGSPIFFLIS